MSPVPRRARADEAGFTMIEVLLATLLMTVILGALATVTAQWLPNWNRGMARVQRAERLAIGLERITADLSVAEMTPINGEAKETLAQGLLGMALKTTEVTLSLLPDVKRYMADLRSHLAGLDSRLNALQRLALNRIIICAPFAHDQDIVLVDTPGFGDGFDIAKTPNYGEPGTWYTNPGSKQMRLYGDTGAPVVDFDFDHDHGQGIPHAHNYGPLGADGAFNREGGRSFSLLPW